MQNREGQTIPPELSSTRASEFPENFPLGKSWGKSLVDREMKLRLSNCRNVCC